MTELIFTDLIASMALSLTSYFISSRKFSSILSFFSFIIYFLIFPLFLINACFSLDVIYMVCFPSILGINYLKSLKYKNELPKGIVCALNMIIFIMFCCSVSTKYIMLISSINNFILMNSFISNIFWCLFAISIFLMLFVFTKSRIQGICYTIILIGLLLSFEGYHI